MKHSTILRTAVIAEVVLLPAYIGVGMIADRHLPPELMEWEAESLVADTLLGMAGFLSYAMAVLCAWLLAVIGLVMLRKWGAWLYLATTVLSLPLYQFMGVDVMHPLELTFDVFYGLFPGFILAMAFFSGAIPRQDTVEHERQHNS